jgi:hypothetical protein
LRREAILASRRSRRRDTGARRESGRALFAGWPIANVEKAIREGASLVILSDRDVSADRAPIPSLLATPRCITPAQQGPAHEAGLIVESGEPREVMHFCLLCGYGANAVNPYLAFESLDELQRQGELRRRHGTGADRDNYIAAIKKGILKTMSKMGISTLRSYCGAQLFEAIGLDRDVVDRYFTGTSSRIAGSAWRRSPARPWSGTRRPSSRDRRRRWTSTSAANTTSATTASGTCGTRRPSPSSSTRSRTTTLPPTRSTPRRSTTRPGRCARCGAVRVHAGEPVPSKRSTRRARSSSDSAPAR